MLRTMVGIAFSSGASRNTTWGDFPPSSRCRGIRFRAHASMIRLPAKIQVIGGIGYTNFDLWAASAGPEGRRQQNFYMLGSMGLAVPIALGVAIAQPRRKVFALEGDGSILMQLGSLSTVAALKPGITCAIIAIALTAWPPYARLARADTLTVRNSDFIAAVRLTGAAGRCTPCRASRCASRRASSSR